jgi:dimethylaniline monooxygenase (N-oxide forming)
MSRVAIIGAGPAGLAAARWLGREGFETVLFEKGASLGGQWAADPAYSGVWPSMHTNTCRDMTRFGDLDHEPGTPTFPSHRAMLAYLQRYAQRFGLLQRIRTRSEVLGLDRSEPQGWALRFAGPDGDEHEEVFGRVVVASGRFNIQGAPISRASTPLAGTWACRTLQATSNRNATWDGACSSLDAP